MPDALQHRVEERAVRLEHVRQVLAADEAVETAWLFGSAGRNDADAFSDLDVAIVVTDEHMDSVSGGPVRPANYANVLASARGRFAARVREPLLLVEAPQNAPAGGAFLSSFYDGAAGPQSIDWEWQPRSRALRPEDSVLLLDRYALPSRPCPDQPRPLRNPVPELDPIESAVQHATSAWAMLIWASKGAARNPNANSVPLMPHLFNCVHHLERFLGRSSDPIAEAAIVTGHQKMQLIHEVADRMTTLTPLLNASRVELSSRIITQVARYLSLVDQVIAMAD